MDCLPIELVEAIAIYLPTEDAKALSQTCKLCHVGCKRRIWSFPKFRQIDCDPFLCARDIKHLPIKKLYSGDLIDDETCSPHDLPPTLQELYITGAFDTEEALTRFRGSRFMIYIYTDALREYDTYLPAGIYETIRGMSNIKADTGETYDWNSNGMMLFRFLQMRGIPFKTFRLSHIIYDWISEKFDLIYALSSYDIEEIYLNRLRVNCRTLIFNISDIEQLQHTNIVEISTRVLLEDTDWEHPWPVLRNIRTLRKIYFNFRGTISLWNLKKFSFYAAQIDDDPIVMVRDIVEVRELIEDDNSDFNYEGPEWVFTIWFGLTLYLNVSN